MKRLLGVKSKANEPAMTAQMPDTDSTGSSLDIPKKKNNLE